MPALTDFLERFRPAGAPGPAGTAVPADRAAELAAELEPVFALLRGAEAERALILRDGAADAQRILESARVEAARIVSRAREQAPAERADAASAVVTAAAAEQAELAARSERAAEAVRRQAADRMAELTTRAVDALMPSAGGRR